MKIFEENMLYLSNGCDHFIHTLNFFLAMLILVYGISY